MVRKIKFRGQSIETDAIVYGYLVVYENMHYTHWIITPGIEPNVPVKPESVAQFIGVDKNGAEVYEGDKLSDNRGEYYGDSATVYIRAFLRHIAPSTGKEFDYFWSQKLVDSWEVVKIEDD